jgi:hypothetical protein
MDVWGPWDDEGEGMPLPKDDTPPLPNRVIMGSITILAFFDENGKYRYKVTSTGELRTDQALGLLELAKFEFAKKFVLNPPPEDM